MKKAAFYGLSMILVSTALMASESQTQCPQGDQSTSTGTTTVDKGDESSSNPDNFLERK